MNNYKILTYMQACIEIEDGKYSTGEVGTVINLIFVTLLNF